MTNIAGGDSEAAAIFAEFAKTVQYTGSGLNNQNIPAIKTDVPADSFQGNGENVRKVSFEVRKSDVPDPETGDLLTDAGGLKWRVNSFTDRDDVDGWELLVEAQ